MMERDQELKCGGHFLIMDTGHGKTVTSLLYAYRRDKVGLRGFIADISRHLGTQKHSHSTGDLIEKL